MERLENSKSNWFERCCMAYLQVRREKQQQSIQMQELYNYYRGIGNLIYCYIWSHDFFEEKPQNPLEIMDDAYFSMSCFPYFQYKWGYRGTTKERLRGSLASYLSDKLKRPVAVLCTDYGITVHLK